jgi:predicted Holliday junction resolvase-like endonuclease
MRKGRLIQIILSCLALLLVLVNILLMMGNQSVQTEVGDRQQYIAQAIQLENLSRQVVGAMANMALKSNDEALKKLLMANGIDLDATGGTAPRSK